MDTREQILQVAGKLLAKRGYWGVSMQDIAGNLGISKAALYYHFPSKQALTLALLQQTYEEFFTAIEKAEQGTRNPAAKLLSVIDTYITFALEKPQISFLLFTETAELDESIRIYLDQVHQDVKKFFRQVIGSNLNKKESGQLNTITEFLWGVLSNFGFLKTLTSKKSAKEITDLILPDTK